MKAITGAPRPALLQCHGLTCPGGGGTAASPRRCTSRAARGHPHPRAIASPRVGLPLGPDRSSGLGHPRDRSRRAIAGIASRPPLLCHGLTCLAVAGGRLLHPGDAQVEPLEASRIRALLLLHASAYPPARIDRRGAGHPRDRFAKSDRRHCEPPATPLPREGHWRLVAASARSDRLPPGTRFGGVAGARQDRDADHALPLHPDQGAASRNGSVRVAERSPAP
jgi:hypothetical protein